ncbi:MAG TPA: peptidylprolyl isomerase [Gemmatimonadaceae bacterium]|nr:peptidylprolyl isomerase [Gemmatimonadaceae bacterium]
MVPRVRNIAIRVARDVAHCLFVAALAACASRSGDAALDRVLMAEDQRPTDAAALAPIFASLHDTSASITAVAIRAVGRLQRPALVDSIAPFLAHGDAVVRAEAANAIAQSVQPGTDTAAVARARTLLLDRLTAASADADRGVVARSVGRLPHESSALAQDVAERIAQAVVQAGEPATSCERSVRPAPLPAGVSASLLFGAMHGIYSVARRARSLGCGATGLALSALVFIAPAPGDSAVWVRELAMLALQSANRTNAATLTTAAADADPRVRRLAMRIPRDLLMRAAVTLVSGGIDDTATTVRIDAVRALVTLRAPQSCGLALRALRDPAPHVSREAIDATAAACDSVLAAPLLDTLVRRLPKDTMDVANGSWHAPARALVALARMTPARATPHFPRFAQHPVWQVRAALAAAARASGDTAQLVRLLRDRDSNVREETITMLAQLGPALREQGIRSGLADSAYQVVLAAATAAKDVPTIDVQSLKGALDRLTARGQETSRDPRRELLERIAERGSAADTSALAPYLADFDVLIARRAAEIMSRWTGRQIAAAQRPQAKRAETLSDPAPTNLRIVLSAASGGGVILVRLYPSEARTTVARVARLAEAGHYNGRTLHRVVPNFVIQGGSPDANEYVGDGPFMRDELGLRSHTRGTLGISTRGRDTGDAQLFINLVDNFRLDHDYTVFGEVVDGLDVVDRVEAGAVMRSVSVVAPAR